MASVVRAAGKASVSLVPPVAAAGLRGCGGRGELGVGVPVRSLWGAHALGKRMTGTALDQRNSGFMSTAGAGWGGGTGVAPSPIKEGCHDSSKNLARVGGVALKPG